MELASKPDHILNEQGITRRNFLKFCGVVAGALGLEPVFGSRIFEAFAAGPRPTVLWLHFAECTGCTEAVLRTSSPGFADLIFDAISLDYHETLMAAAGDTADRMLTAAAETHRGEFFCVVEGAIPTAAGGVFGWIGGRTMLDIAREICPKAKAIISLGNCASYGGLPAAWPNPTGAMGVEGALGTGLRVPVINLPGCPPNPVNFVGTLANYLLFGRLPELDGDGRPKFAYAKPVHGQCPFRDDKSRCLFEGGCKGKKTFNNCPSVKFNDGTSFPMQAGHPCIGCSEPDFWDTMTPFYRKTS
jgi:[NiFe] hydrogenase small subunit